MDNPLNQFLRGNQQQSLPNNPLAVISKFRQFAAGMTPEGAKQQVEQMLYSGQMTQEQFQQLKQPATEFLEFLK